MNRNHCCRCAQSYELTGLGLFTFLLLLKGVNPRILSILSYLIASSSAVLAYVHIQFFGVGSCFAYLSHYLQYFVRWRSINILLPTPGTDIPVQKYPELRLIVALCIIGPNRAWDVALVALVCELEHQQEIIRRRFFANRFLYAEFHRQLRNSLCSVVLWFCVLQYYRGCQCIQGVA